MKVSEIIGKSVVSMSDGEKVGTVQDVIIDSGQLRATAIVLGGTPGQGYLPFETVKSIGNDAVTIETAQVIQWATQVNAATGRPTADLKKLPVMDASGTELGKLQDILVDIPSGQIVSLLVAGGGVFGIGAHRQEITSTHLRAIGPAFITAEIPAETEGK